jgi:hypothetical protein
MGNDRAGPSFNSLTKVVTEILSHSTNGLTNRGPFSFTDAHLSMPVRTAYASGLPLGMDLNVRNLLHLYNCHGVLNSSNHCQAHQ